MNRIFFLALVQVAWTMPLSNDKRYIHDVVGLVKEDLRFYEQLENAPLLVSEYIYIQFQIIHFII